MRLDLNLSQTLNISRNKSNSLIKKGRVFVNQKCIKKPSFQVEKEDSVYADLKDLYVSRAGEKLAGFLDEYNLDIKDKTCLDIGSSTGGFVQVLLFFDPKKIVAVDVGKNQLHQSLKNEDRIYLHEECDIRDFNFDEIFDIITCDVSFISFKAVASSIDKFAKEDIIILFKPQFEVGKEVKRDKKGVVKDKKAIQKAKDEFEQIAKQMDWVLQFKKDSIIKGKEGNLESFYAFKKR